MSSGWKFAGDCVLGGEVFRAALNRQRDSQRPAKFEFKRAKNLENRGPGRYPIGFWDQKWTKFRSWMLLCLLSCPGGVLENWKKNSGKRFGTVLSGSLVPTWVPKWSQLGQKIAPKIVHFLDASWNRFSWILMDFGSQNGAKLAPKWDQISISQKTRKNAFGASPLVPNWVQGI